MDITGKGTQQQELVSSIPYFRELFHDGYYNNFSYILINKRFDAEQLSTQKKQELEQLNIASYNLQTFCNIWLKDEGVRACMPSADINMLAEVCDDWKTHIKYGNSFLTYSYAETILNALKGYKVPVIEMLYAEKYRVIPQAFTTVPYKTKACIKINHYGEEKELGSMLQLIFEGFYKAADLFYYVERIEIARNDLSFSLIPEYERYPLFSIIPDRHIVNTRLHPAMGELTQLLGPVFCQLPEKSVPMEYSLPFDNNTTISQGFKNYKKFLFLINALDEVYDHSSNYAFIK